MKMKFHDAISFSFKRELARIRRQEAERASRYLILRPGREADLVSQHLSVHSQFCRACVACGYLTQQQMEHAARRYRLGMARDGGVIFWQIDQLGCVFDGKVMYYRTDCHRDHHRQPTWVSSELKHFYLADSPQLAADIPSRHCLFGTHLISENVKMKSEKSSIVVAVVEAEKTAVIMSERFPDCLWLAAGGLNELTATKLFPLRGRRIILFPDTDEDGHAYAVWYHVMQEAQRLLGHSVHLSPLLERQASPDQKRRKIDLVDFLFESHRIL